VLDEGIPSGCAQGIVCPCGTARLPASAATWTPTASRRSITTSTNPPHAHYTGSLGSLAPDARLAMNDVGNCRIGILAARAAAALAAAE